MLLTTDEEIRALMPTSKWNDVDMLLSCVEEEEWNSVVNLLGDELMNKFVEDYEALKAEHGGITPDLLKPEEITDKAMMMEVRAIRICQKIQLFLALAHNAGLLSVQLNSGGGLNQATAEYYDKADEKSVERFVKDAYMKAHRNTDELLTLLERDARSPEPQFSDLWKKSIYYYEQSGLLLTTALQMQYYLNIGNSRAKFIELVPDLKFVQQHYVLTRLGRELTDALIRYATDESVVPAPDASLTEEEQEKRKEEIESAWAEALNQVRMATAIYTEWRNPQMRRKESLDEANLSMSSAVSYITEHADCFMPYVEKSPFYTPPVTEEEIFAKGRRACICGNRPKYDPCNPDNKVTSIFGTGLLRH